MSVIADAFEDVGNFFEDVGEDIGNAVEDVGDTVGDAFQFVGDEVGNFVESASNELAGLDDAVNDAIPGGWATVAAVVITVASAGTVNLEGETMALTAGEIVAETAVETGLEIAAEAATEAVTEAVIEAGAEAGLNAAGQAVLESTAESMLEQNVSEKMITEAVQKLAINTAMNGGDIEKGLKQTALSYAGGGLTSEFSEITGSDLAGRILSNATIQLATTGEIDPTRIAISEVGNFVGKEVAGETDSKLAGNVASTLTRSALSGKDPTASLLGLGVGEALNEGERVLKDANIYDNFTNKFKDETFPNVAKDLVFDSNPVTDETKPESTKIDTAPEGGLSSLVKIDAKTTDGGLNSILPTSNPVSGSGRIDLDGNFVPDSQTPATDPYAGWTRDPVNGDLVAPNVGQPVADIVPNYSTSQPIGGLPTSTPTAEPVQTTGGLSNVIKDLVITPQADQPPEGVQPSDLPPVAEKQPPEVKPVVPEEPKPLTIGDRITSILKPAVKSTIGSSLVKSMLPSSAPKQQMNSAQMNAMRIAATKSTPPPTRMDISKLMPMSQKTAPAYTPPPSKVDVTKLKPVLDIASLSSILSNLKRTG